MKCWFWTVVATGLVLMQLVACGPKIEDGQAGYVMTESSHEEDIEEGQHQPLGQTTVTITEPGQAALTDFELTSSNNKQVSREQLKGAPYVASFFFSICKATCPQQNERVQLMRKRFAGKNIKFLSISCDPEVDTPDVLNEYAKRFDAATDDQWLFLTGDLSYIRRVGFDIFQLGIVRRGHPNKFILVGSDGEVIKHYTWTEEDDWKQLLTDIDELID